VALLEPLLKKAVSAGKTTLQAVDAQPICVWFYWSPFPIKIRIFMGPEKCHFSWVGKVLHKNTLRKSIDNFL